MTDSPGNFEILPHASVSGCVNCAPVPGFLLCCPVRSGGRVRRSDLNRKQGHAQGMKRTPVGTHVAHHA